MIQIRQGVFETNSSSTHAISVVRHVNEQYEIPESIHFGLTGQYGWENNVYHNVSDKANYLWIATCSQYSSLDDEATLIRIKADVTKILNDYGVKHVSFEDADYITSKYNSEQPPYLDIDGYIDHHSDLYGWIDEMIEDPELLIGYLFHPHSYIHTGNDNNDTDITWAEDAEMDIYKGN